MVDRHENAFLYDYEVERVPEEQTRPWWDIALVWAGLWASGFAILTGTLFAGSGLSLGDIIAINLVGNSIIWVLYTLNGMIGVKERLPINFIARNQLGYLGAKVLSLIVVIVTVGFAALGLQMIAEGFASAFGISIEVTAWIAALAILASAIAGYKTLSLLSKVVLPYFLIGVPLLSVVAIHSISGPIWGVARHWGAPFTFWSGITYVVGMSIAASFLTPNMARYAKKPKDIVPATALGAYWVGVVLVILAGALGVYANTTNVYDILYIAGGAMGIFLFIGLVWTTADNDYYHGALAAVELYEKIPKWIYTTTFIVLSVFLIYANFLGKIVEWCATLAIALPPYPGILLADYYILPRLGIKKKYDVRPKMAINWVAFIAWGIGIGVAYYVKNNIGILPSIAGLLSAAAVYIILTLPTYKKRGGE